MPKRRVLRGKSLPARGGPRDELLVAAGIAGASFGGLSCVSNPMPPPREDSGAMDASASIDASDPMDAMSFPFDGPVANLVAPPEDASNDAGEPSDAQVIGFPDAPVANLLPPPEK